MEPQKSSQFSIQQQIYSSQMETTSRTADQ